jgi:hypothetical protein
MRPSSVSPPGASTEASRTMAPVGTSVVDTTAVVVSGLV